ncbi:MAG: DNA repair protein RecO [Ruminococcus sp.]|nr:DNA repair protein RecO [Ruminococcus sp.]
MKFITNGLIIREQNIGERDKLVTALTETHGVVKGFVHGAKDIKSSKSAATSLLSYSRLTLHKRKENYLIGDAKAVKIFSGLRNSIENMYLAQYFCELAGVICPKEQEAKEQLRLILNALYLLSENKREFSLIKPCVELRLMCLAGYMPDIMMCRECGEYEKDVMMFLPKFGQFVCKECFEKNEDTSYKINLNRSTVTAMRHCCYADAEKLFSFSLPEKDLKVLNFCSEEYIKFILERDFKTLRFLKTII